jgi:catechol 2,3-dioxygenase-like lactoylglutathione lyase family enzyme
MIHHIELYVSDLNVSMDFWEWLLGGLGYTRFQSWENGSSFKLGETYLVFVQVEDRFKDKSYHRCGVGLNHLAFQARSREQVDEVTRILEQREVPILYQDRHPYAGGGTHYAVYFEDPDRIKVELVAP